MSSEGPRVRRGPQPARVRAAERLSEAVVAWFGRNRRDLPWRRVTRTGRRDPYRSLVSEFMLQQTQVSRVVEKYREFLARFPSVRALAAAKDEDVLASWAGLGYYRRARLLHRAAQRVVTGFGGRVPETIQELRTLPGVGRYTAGAIASLVYGRPEPLVDGNVVRVLLRVEGRRGAADDPSALRAVWARAGELVRATEDPGALNEGLMELGATVCTPVAPNCGVCPLARSCVACRSGRQDRIPRPKRAIARRTVVLWCAVVTDAKGRILLERAPEGALWAGLWRLPTWEGPGVGRVAAEALGTRLGIRGMAFTPAGRLERQLSHRRVVMRLLRATSGRSAPLGAGGRWVRPEDLAEIGVSNAHLAAIERVMSRQTKGPRDGLSRGPR